ncbi:MAG: DUF3795 domain-containing protein [Dehalococcoidia bacterium]|nr:MAG: DUF3795 domain-containing protein [Dehalococcoidia bacterium]
MQAIATKLAAPCGMNCAICSGYLAYKNHPRFKGIVSYCRGCRPRNKQCAFLKKRCADNLKLLAGEVNFCFECNCFPCEGLKHLDARYRREFNMSMIENLMEIKENGLDGFLEKQYQKYACQRCGDLISVHSQKCFSCDEIKDWKH